ncbi:S-layer homology domain-containing protein [Paenibacillus sp. CC-CFT742]|nr:S-layer homology domain-containing protein [Paenibacillus sp. CC-CFT742]WJH30182.1 S-layer homology domain-containing protein [Paenibacillus sp. CC-CFT742]
MLVRVLQKSFIFLLIFSLVTGIGPTAAMVSASDPNSYEAEADGNTLSGNASVSDSPSASGGKKVGGMYQGSSLQFNNVIVNESGNYKVVVYYISGDPRPFNISANGGAKQFEEPPKTADWDTVGTYDVTLPLNAGSNSILIDDNNWYSPDIDKIVIAGLDDNETEPGIPGEEEDLGTPGDTHQYGTISVTDYTYGFLVANDHYEVTYNTQSGVVGYSWADGQKLRGVYSSMKLGDESFVQSKDYEEHTTAGAPRELKDGFGKGIELSFVHTSAGKPTLKQVYRFYEDKAYFLTGLNAIGETEIHTNYMSPITVTRAGGVDIGDSSDNRVLTVPFDNDAWIRYKSQTMNRTDTSYEMTAIFNNATRNGLVIGSVTHDTWKTGIDWQGSANRIHELSVYGGAATDVTRDTQPHGSLTGTELSSPLIMVGGFRDYRTGLEEYGKANAVITPPLELNPELPQGVPFGWNSWGAYGSTLSYQNVVDVSTYFKNNLDKFNNEGNVFINMDSYWDNLSDEELAQAVSVIKGNGQHAGIYWAPFVYWGNNMSQTVEGTNNQYTYGDIVLKDSTGKPLPTLDGAYPLDVTHPGAKMRMDYFLDKFKNLGFTYIKLDFLTHGSLEGVHYDEEVTTGIQAYNQGMRYVEGRLDGKMFISASIAPIFPSQYAHSRRISCDSYGSINETEYMLNSLTYGFWQNGTIYSYTDPDHLVLAKASSLTEARSRVNSGVIAGTVMMASDDVHDPKAQEYMTALYNNTDVLDVAKKGKVFRPLEGNTNANAADTFVLKDGDNYYLALFNYSATSSAERTIDLERAGLNAVQTYSLKDLWTGEVSSVSGSWSVTLEAAESRLVKLTEMKDTPGNPGNPSNPGNPGNPGVPGNSGSTGNTQGSSINENNGSQESATTTLSITADMLKTNKESGQAIVEIKADTQEVQLSSAAIKQLGNDALVLKSGKLGLHIPAEVLQQLMNKLPEQQQEGSIVTLKMVPLGSEGNKIIAAAQDMTQARVSLKSEIYAFSISIQSKSGFNETLSKFDKPVVLSLHAVEGFEPSKGGMYAIGEQGKLEFVRGEYAANVLTGEISEFGTYAVLELERSFTDVPAYHWASPVIHELAAKLIVQGTHGGLFEPGREVTRAEFASMLVHSLGLNTAGEMEFRDVAADRWYAAPISIAYKVGIVSGKSRDAFEPDLPITREEMAVMVMKGYSLGKDQEPVDTNGIIFGDMNLVAPWAADSVTEAANRGLIQGNRHAKFEPKGIASRAEATQVIYNLIQK